MTDTESKILRQYYKEKDFISSTDGILKVLSVIACIVVGVLALSTRPVCTQAPPLASSAGATTLISAAVLCMLTGAGLLALPARTPMLWLYTNTISCAVISAQLVVAVTLSLIFCQRDSTLVYIYFVVGVATVALTGGSAVLGYSAAMRSVDAARPKQKQQDPPSEQEV
ncbi:hypothetical protein NE865_15271 [Phthorimaea operculella]|nr:hypothetical protein NE865_15271 [Phthorimaea operculella]